jgi:hypothetical protein
LADLNRAKRKTTINGKEVEYEVYRRENTWVIEEDNALHLAAAAGLHDPKVVSLEAHPDHMHYGHSANPKREQQLAQKRTELPEATRWVCRYQWTKADGTSVEDVANAAPDNVDMSTMLGYLPEMATKRARVRSALLGLGMKDLNADIEFASKKPETAPEGDYSNYGTESSMTEDDQSILDDDMIAATVIPFGKYKGKTLKDVAPTDSAYLEWVSKKSDNAILRNACAEYLKRGLAIFK